ncbi:MAG: type II toxin-antitoxin system VapC family toxin [Polyangiaceae bacterium]
MRVLLDTHVWIWYATDDRKLGRHAQTLDRAALDGELLVSAISFYEAGIIGTETNEGRRRGARAIEMRPTVQAWIREAQVATRITVIDVEPEHALEAALLTAMHPDPFDRLIVATAMSEAAKLATADENVIAFAKRAKLAVLAL